jgi:aspartyl-tRNA(Asn)/glutamyl-tRNA(Gln) amidotransferase subunit A
MSGSAGPEPIVTLQDAAVALRAGRITSVELTEQALAVADAHDERVGAFLLRFPAQALERAARADAQLADGVDLGPLHGIPLGIKDIITTDEGPTTAQSLVHDPDWNPRDAVVVARLRSAGAVIVGKTTTMEFAAASPDPAKPFPIPRNPWNLDTWPGGSSSGTGAGVAAGMFFGGLGTDTGGSIRIPAASCGITGLMPTFGRVPKSGCVPLGYSLDHIGPMARSAWDCAVMLQALAGADSSDPGSLDEPVPDYLAALAGPGGSVGDQGWSPLAGLRIGVDRLSRVRDPRSAPETDALLDAVSGALGQLGATLVDVEIPWYLEGTAALGPIAGSEMLAYHMPDAQTRLADYFAGNRNNLVRGVQYSGADYVQAQRVRRVIQRDVASLLVDVDLVLSPTLTTGAIPHATLGPDLWTWMSMIHTAYWDLTGNPVISVPMGLTDAGLPLAFQLAGRPFDEPTVLRAAHAYQGVTSWHRRVPDLDDLAAATIAA